MAPTFGANRANLAHHGVTGQTETYNKRLVELSQKAAAGKALVAADLSPTGLFIPPFGETPFDELMDIYAQASQGLPGGGRGSVCAGDHHDHAPRPGPRCWR